MKKSFYTIFAVFVALNFSQAQTKIKDGTVPGSSSLPVNSAVLELESTNKGLLYPRVSLASTSSWGLSGTATAGTIVYNTNASISSTIADPKLPGGIGSYYWDGVRWVGTGATAMGQWPYASNDGSTGTTSLGIKSLNGTGNVASGSYSHAEGLNCTASNTHSFAFGTGCTASGLKSIAIGDGTTASGRYSFTYGEGNTVSGQNAVSFGLDNNIAGFYHIVNGQNNIIDHGSSYGNCIVGSNNTIEGDMDQNLIIGGGNTSSVPTATFYSNNTLLGGNNNVTGSDVFVKGAGNSITYGDNCFIVGSGNSITSATKVENTFILGNSITGITTSNRFISRFTSGYQLYTSATNGAQLTGTSWGTISDRRSKNSIQEIKYGLNAVMNLKPSMYKYNGNDYITLGFIAQEVNEVLPEVVEQSEMGPDHDYLAIKYSEMIPVLTKAIQEQQAEIERLKSEVTQLTEMNKQYAELSNQVKSLQQMMGMNTTAPKSETH